MGTYMGTSGDDSMYRGYISAGVVPDPPNTAPSDVDDSLYGQEGNDNLEGAGGNDTFYGGTGNDDLGGGFETGNDVLYGEDGNDRLLGGDGTDVLDGGSGDDHLEGLTGDDTLQGSEGVDTLYGGDGNDRLNGGGGQERSLYGGSGNDIFDFDTTGDSAVGESRDIIRDFESRVDKLDVSTIQAFAFMGTASPTGPGQLTLVDAINGDTIVLLNTDNDREPESEIAIVDGSVPASSYTASDFILAEDEKVVPNILQNGSFEEGTDPGAYLPLNPGSKDISEWEVIRGGIDYVGTDWVSSDGNRSLDLNGTPGVGGVAQAFDTTPGHNYNVTFDLAGHYSGLPQTMRVSAVGESQDFSFQSGTDPSKLGWQEQTWEFTATAPQTTLEFYSLQTAYEFGGPALDNVAVTEADLLLA